MHITHYINSITHVLLAKARRYATEPTHRPTIGSSIYNVRTGGGGRGGKTPYAFPISVMLKEVRTGGGGSDFA